jgi:hypothetical protein
MHSVRMVFTQRSSIEPLGGIMFPSQIEPGLLRRPRRREENARDALYDQFDRLADT